ncbi:MAG TPA: J domain-containing protein [Byssovorax sp.]|jgi:hypothetical protein
MNLPGRLAGSTLGDLLGALHRSRITGVVELAEVAGAGRGVPGRRHRIALADGLVADVDTELAGADDLRARLDALFALGDAAIRFHIATTRADRRRLGPREFLHGRPRARDARGRAAEAPRAAPSAAPVADAAELSARAELGVGLGASEDEIRRAFRKLARSLHPDLFAHDPSAAESARARFSAISVAYTRLTRRG